MVSGLFSISWQPCSDADPAVACTDSPATLGTGVEGTRVQEDSAQEFGRYVGSDENRLVQVAAEGLLNREASFSPLILYGPTGTGKSLLAQGLAQRWRSEHPNDRLLTFTGADFARAFAGSIETASLHEFRSRWQTADLMVIDDLHQMSRKSAAQEELVTAIDEMQVTERCILVTLPRCPAAMVELKAPLRSRLAGGLSVPLLPPGQTARRLLLRDFAEDQELQLTDGALEALVEGVPAIQPAGCTVPDMRHTITRLRFLVDDAAGPIDEEFVFDLLRREAQAATPTLREVCHSVARHFAVSMELLRGSSRRRHVVRARGVAMLLSRQMVGASLGTIGRYFGGRDHTTVLHACRKTSQLSDTDVEIASTLNQLSEQLRLNFKIHRTAAVALPSDS